MTSVVAFEGNLLGAYHATWGTAALRVGNKLVNPTTGSQCPIEQLDELVEQGNLYRLPQPIDIDDRASSNPIVLIAINRNSRHHEKFIVDKGRHGGLLRHVVQEETEFYVARNVEALRLFSVDIINGILRAILAYNKSEPIARELTQAGLELDPFHPCLNALRVYFAEPNSAHVEKLARSCLRGPDSKQAFDDYINALRSGNRKHILSYRGGVTEGGGLDVNVAASILGNIAKVTEKLARVIRGDLSFLPTVQPPRLYDLCHGSARLEFVTDLENRSLGERVARYLELRALEQALVGDTPSELRDDSKFTAAIESVTRPTPETALYQKPLDKDDLEPVSFDTQFVDDDFQEEVLTVLGLVTGALADAEKLEIRLFPGVRGRMLLSTTDNGQGVAPVGIEAITTNERISFFRLAVMNLLRQSDSSGRERFYLQSIALVANKPATILAIPSSVVPGAFRFTQLTKVQKSGHKVYLGKQQVAKPFRENKVAALAWLVEYQSACERIELSDKKMKWTRMLRPPRPTSLARALVSLHALDSCATADALAAEISRRYGTIARINNTRREVIHNKRFLDFDPDDDKVIHLTEDGKRYVKAYCAAGGDVGDNTAPSEE